MRPRRGQTLVLLALTMLLVVLMACMTLSISNRVRRKLELQTLADTAAYNNAVSTARGFNSLGLINRTIVSHWVVMLGIEANLAWGSSVPAYFDGFADQLNDLRFPAQCPVKAQEDLRQKELTAARDAFNHASLSLWSGPGSGKDDIGVPGCPKSKCFPRLKPGLAQLDKAVTDQTRAVWRSVRDLVEVQRDIQAELQQVLEAQTLATQATLAAQGKPLNLVDTFPYVVHRGAATSTVLGLPGRPPGWREVSNALGTTRSALEPLAHAAMGSRGSRFVISGKYEKSGVFFPYTPKRAKRYAKRIEDAMNSVFGRPGRKPFEFSVRANQSATFLDNGGNKDNGPDGDIDEIYQYVEEVDGTIEDDSGEEATDAPTEYDPNSARRITPARSIGLEYASAHQNGTATLTYRSPCGSKTYHKAITAMARVHTRMTAPAVSSHEWQQGIVGIQKIDAVGAPDGTRDYRLGQMSVLHGNRQAKHGWDDANHGPSGQCHPGHLHWGEADDSIHTLGDEIDGLGISPGGFGFVFPQTGKDLATGLDRDGASGAFGQPKLPVLLTRANTGGGLTPDPWNLTFRFSFTRNGAGQRIDLAKAADPTPVTALATGMAYYHRRCGAYRPSRNGAPNGPGACVSWNEAPNLLNPFWRATLVPIDVDETAAGTGSTDQTPGNRLLDEAPTMLDSAGLTDAAATYRLLKARGFEGIQ